MAKVPSLRSWNGWFWGLVGAVTILELALLWVGIALASRTVPCFWAGSEMFGWEYCTAAGTGVWMYVVPLVVTVVILASLIVGVAVAARTILETHRRVRPILARTRTARTEVQNMVREVGSDPPEVLEVDLDEPVCFVHGLVRPAIVISSGLVDELDNRQLRAVLTHELRHVQVRDPLKVVAARGLSAAAFPFPILRDLVDHILLQCELNADEVAAASAGPRTIAETLTQVMFHPRYAVDTAFGAPETARARIARLAGHPAPSLNVSRGGLATSFVSLIAVVVTTTAAFTILPAPPPAYATGDAPPSSDLGWTPEPGPSPGDPQTVERRLHEACDPSMRMLADNPIPDHLGPDFPTEPMPLVTSDSRGEITVAVFAQGRHAFTCIVDRVNPDAWQVIGGGGPIVPADAPGTTTALHQDTSTVREGVVTSISGTAAPEVDEVTIELVDGTLVRATIGDGYYLAWWPTAIEPESIIAFQEGEVVAEIPPPDMTTGSSGS